jgi:hypothetical protein
MTPGAHGGEVLPANLDLVAGLAGLCLGSADDRELRMGERRQDDEVLVDRMGGHADGALDRDRGFLAGPRGGRLATAQVAVAKTLGSVVCP